MQDRYLESSINYAILLLYVRKGFEYFPLRSSFLYI